MKAVSVLILLTFTQPAFAESCKEIFEAAKQLSMNTSIVIDSCEQQMMKKCEDPKCMMSARFICVEALIGMKLDNIKKFNRLKCWNKVMKTRL